MNVFAQSVVRTPWQYIRAPLPPILITSTVATTISTDFCQAHGSLGEFSLAPPIPAATDPTWTNCGDTFCTRVDTIAVGGTQNAPNSRLNNACNNGTSSCGCLQYLDFSFFQTYIIIPQSVSVTQASVDFTFLDDGAIVTVFNSLNPTGIQVPGSHTTLCGPTYGCNGCTNADFSSYLTTGQNRIVVTQVDDCVVSNDVFADISVNGNTLPPTCIPSNPCYVSTYLRDSGTCFPEQPGNNGSLCNDGNACTITASCQNGLCLQNATNCCYNSKSKNCGICVKNCGNDALDVLSFYSINGTRADVSAAEGGGNVCSGPDVCCCPKNQTGVVVINGHTCYIPSQQTPQK